MRCVRPVLVAAAAALLSGCWMGGDFYAGQTPVQPLQPGRYKIVDGHHLLPDVEQKEAIRDWGTRVRIAYAKDGSVHVEASSPEQGTDGPQTARLFPFDEERRIYVAQIDPGEGVAETNARIYALVALTPTGYRVAAPKCDGTRRLKPGSPVIVSGPLFGLRCNFATKAQFEQAMRAYVEDPVSWTEYRWIRS